MAWETKVQSQAASYQRLKKWYLIPPCLTFSIIRYLSRVKWSNPGEGVAFSPTPQCSSYWKGSLWVALDYGHQFYLLFPKGISPKVAIIAQQQFKFTYYDVAVQHISHYATEILTLDGLGKYICFITLGCQELFITLCCINFQMQMLLL